MQQLVTPPKSIQYSFPDMRKLRQKEKAKWVSKPVSNKFKGKTEIIILNNNLKYNS